MYICRVKNVLIAVPLKQWYLHTACVYLLSKNDATHNSKCIHVLCHGVVVSLNMASKFTFKRDL